MNHSIRGSLRLVLNGRALIFTSHQAVIAWYSLFSNGKSSVRDLKQLANVSIFPVKQYHNTILYAVKVLYLWYANSTTPASTWQMSSIPNQYQLCSLSIPLEKSDHNLEFATLQPSTEASSHLILHKMKGNMSAEGLNHGLPI
ncbi:hypothetical protein ACOSP7_011047 [Xanthoceras sorbifolium]